MAELGRLVHRTSLVYWPGVRCMGPGKTTEGDQRRSGSQSDNRLKPGSFLTVGSQITSPLLLGLMRKESVGGAFR